MRATQLKESGAGGMNRTGMAQSSYADEMSEVTARTNPMAGDGSTLRAERAHYGEEAPTIGSDPVPDEQQPSSTNQRSVLLDKLGERLAFERTGTRLYEGLLLKLDSEGGYEGGPESDELERFREEEAQHFWMLEEAIESLGGDPTTVTPSADLAGLEASGVASAIADPRTTLPQALHAILVAELADNEGWDLLVQLAREHGEEELEASCERAKEQEEMHLASVRAWVSAHTLGNGG